MLKGAWKADHVPLQQAQVVLVNDPDGHAGVARSGKGGGGGAGLTCLKTMPARGFLLARSL